MTPDTLRAATGCPAPLAELYAPHVTAAFAAWKVNTPLRMAHCLAQTAHESTLFLHMEENLNYRAERLCEIWPRRFPSLEFARGMAGAPQRLANYLYGNRNGNRGANTSDGYDFRGRGPMMLTGRNNYAAYSLATTIDVVSQPDTLLAPATGWDSAAWFFSANGCNKMADRDDLLSVRAAVNGPARLGLGECALILDRAKKVLL